MRHCLLSIFLTGLFLSGCTSGPKPINYGDDMCIYCKMNVVDKQHAAEVVSTKGKVFVFDAIECMLNYIEVEEEQWSHLLINDYDNPGTLINAKDSYYLISNNLPSPMGAFLSGFSSKETAEKMRSEKGGFVYSWSEIRNELRQSGVIKN